MWKKPAVYLAVTMVCVLSVMYALLLLDNSQTEWLTSEDGPIETLGAAFFLVSGIVFLITYVLSGSRVGLKSEDTKRSRRNVFYLGLCILFLFCFLEEISWGQRILGWKTPEVLMERNVQKELNVHNLRFFHGVNEEGNRKSFWGLLLNMDRLFSMFWFCACVVVPVANKYVPRIRRMMGRIRVPVVPTIFAALFLCNYLLSKMMEVFLDINTHGIVETKEANIAFLFGCVAIGLLYRTVREGNVVVD